MIVLFNLHEVIVRDDGILFLIATDCNGFQSWVSSFFGLFWTVKANLEIKNHMSKIKYITQYFRIEAYMGLPIDFPFKVHAIFEVFYSIVSSLRPARPPKWYSIEAGWATKIEGLDELKIGLYLSE